jgi:predicted RecA/RadA family phage recombinase
MLRENKGLVNHVNGTGATLSADDVVWLGDRVGIVLADILNGATGAVATAGTFRLPKDATTFAAGDDVDWDDSESKCSDLAGAPASADIEHIGKCVKAAATGASYVDVEINVPITAQLAP